MSWPWNWWRHTPNVQQQMDAQGEGRPSGSIDASTFPRVEPVLRQPGQSRVIQGVIGHAPDTIYPSGSSNPKKRSLEGVQTKPQRSKRAKPSGEKALEQAQSGPVDKKHLVVRKRRRSPTLEEEAIVTKRARADLRDGNVDFPPTCAENDASKVPQNETRNPEPISQLHLTKEDLESTSVTVDHDSFGAECDFDQTSLEEESSTLAATEIPFQYDGAETTDLPTLDSGEHADSTGVQGSVEMLQMRLAGIKRSIEHTAYISHNLQSDFDKPPCPSGRLVGICLWPGSNRIPGQPKLPDNETDIIELPCTWPRSLRKNSAVSIPASKPKHYLARKTVNTLQLPSLYEKQESKSRRKKTASSHVRLMGIWNQSVGSPMGPKTWTK